MCPCWSAGEAQSFLDHIRMGIEEAALDPDALLLFSGGQTRRCLPRHMHLLTLQLLHSALFVQAHGAACRAAGPRSEGLSYWVVAEAAGWYGHPEVRYSCCPAYDS
jgi:hypothetical protein